MSIATPAAATTVAPVPRPTPETRPHWEGAAAGRLVIQRCAACDAWTFVPRTRCAHCEADALEWADASGRGSVWSYIIVHKPMPGFEQIAPYVVATVELAEGPHMMGILRHVDPDPAAIAIGMPVTVGFESRGVTAVPYWRPEGVV